MMVGSILILLAVLGAGSCGVLSAGSYTVNTTDFSILPIFDLTNISAADASRNEAATNTHSCNHVRAVPSSVRSHYRLDTSFYGKYTEAYGIPILGSYNLKDQALKRACYVVRFLFADRYNVRNSYLVKNGRFAIMAANEVTTSIPEYRSLGSWWDTRARGLGATTAIPVSSGAEENLLCYSNDRYRVEDITLHEFSHGLHLLGAYFAIPGFDADVTRGYNKAKYTGLWRNTYAMSTAHEYWAEGVQSYFNVNAYANPPNGIHNHVNTREKLRGYDSFLYNLVKNMFPCNNQYIKRCDDVKSGASATQKLKLNYPSCKYESGGKDIKTTKRPVIPGKTTKKPTKQDCKDINKSCSGWTNAGECQKNPEYMKFYCKKSCNLCGSVSCQDNDKYCSGWAQSGYCKTNKHVIDNCKKSCNFC